MFHSNKHFIFKSVIGLSIGVFTSAGLFASSISVMQYNVENLFDTVHDEGKQDLDFTPEGKFHWTPEALEQKLEHLAEIISTVKSGDGSACPDILTLTEVENSNVLRIWTQGALAICNYKHIITDDRDPDIRGIQVAILSKLELAAKPISIPVYRGGRLIEEASFKIGDRVLTVFANHWKSRLRRPPDTDGGVSKRAANAKIVRKNVDKILAEDPNAAIIVMGDLNDEPEDTSIAETLGASFNLQAVVDGSGPLFYETSADILRRPEFENVDGAEKEKLFKFLRSTFYYSREKSYLQFDHILVSKGLLGEEGCAYVPGSFSVVSLPQYTMPRTHAPYPYAFKEDEDNKVTSHGASDHFPVTARLKCQNDN